MDNEKTLWEILSHDLGEVGAAALMGNMYAESALSPSNLQNSYNKKLGLSDAEYTQAVDSGRYTRDSFVHDSAGYGLCQWTHWSRKANLYDYLKGKGLSVGNLAGQAYFCLKELGDYGLKDAISSATLEEAVAIILRKYEKPADQGDANVKRRLGYAQGFLERNAERKDLKGLILELSEVMARLGNISKKLEGMTK